MNRLINNGQPYLCVWCNCSSFTLCQWEIKLDLLCSCLKANSALLIGLALISESQVGLKSLHLARCASAELKLLSYTFRSISRVASDGSMLICEQDGAERREKWGRTETAVQLKCWRPAVRAADLHKQACAGIQQSHSWIWLWYRTQWSTCTHTTSDTSENKAQGGGFYSAQVIWMLIVSFWVVDLKRFLYVVFSRNNKPIIRSHDRLWFKQHQFGCNDGHWNPEHSLHTRWSEWVTRAEFVDASC